MKDINEIIRESVLDLDANKITKDVQKAKKLQELGSKLEGTSSQGLFGKDIFGRKLSIGDYIIFVDYMFNTFRLGIIESKSVNPNFDYTVHVFTKEPLAGHIAHDNRMEVETWAIIKIDDIDKFIRETKI